jgi:hypothetical protein
MRVIPAEDAAKGNRRGQRDATAILLAYRHGLRGVGALCADMGSGRWRSARSSVPVRGCVLGWPFFSRRTCSRWPLRSDQPVNLGRGQVFAGPDRSVRPTARRLIDCPIFNGAATWEPTAGRESRRAACGMEFLDARCQTFPIMAPNGTVRKRNWLWGRAGGQRTPH